MPRRRMVLLWCLAVVPLIWLALLVGALITGGADSAATVIRETREWQQVLQG